MTDPSLLDPVPVFAQVHQSRGAALTFRAFQTRCSEALKPKTMLHSEHVL